MLLLFEVACFRQLALLGQLTGNPSEAESWYRQAVSLLEPLARESRSVQDTQDLSDVCHQLALLAQAGGRPAEARGWLEQEMSLRKMLARTLGSVEAFLELCDCYELLGNLAQTGADKAEWYQRAYQVLDALSQSVHSPQVASALARVRQKLAQLLP